MKKRNSSELKRQMAGRWLDALPYLAPALSEACRKVGQSVPCPITGKGEDGFRLFDDAADTGGGIKHAEGAFPDGITLLMRINHWTFPEAYDAVLDWMGGKLVSVPEIKYEPCKNKVVDETWLRNWLNTLWKEALPLDHTRSFPARAYLSKRRVLKAGLSASDIRFHPALEYRTKAKKSLGHHPAILCLIRNNLGQPVGIHRTYITTFGVKAMLGGENKAKKMTQSVLKATKGRVVRTFAPQNGVIGISEGMETALSVYQAKQFPVWPGISDTNVRNFVPPEGVHTVINFVDKDRNKAGENSAETLLENLSLKGIQVINLYPPTPILESDPKGVDWNDQLIRDPSGFDILDSVLAELNNGAEQLKHAG